MDGNRRFLTDRFLRSLPPAKRRQRVEIWDTIVPGFGIRVYDIKDNGAARQGRKDQLRPVRPLLAGAAPTRRVIGVYPAITLEDARRAAGKWGGQIARGIDPRVVEEAEREKAGREAALRIRHSFAAVAEDFITGKLSQERSGKVTERTLCGVFIAAWGDRPIREITALDVLDIINTKKRTAPKMAGNLLVIIRRFFNWLIDQHVYGLTASPCDRLSVVKLVGPMSARDRRLNDDELRAFWRGSGRRNSPAGALYRMLLLTGLRLNERAHLSWPEVQGDTIIILARRMKGKDGRAREHLVPRRRRRRRLSHRCRAIGTHGSCSASTRASGR